MPNEQPKPNEEQTPEQHPYRIDGHPPLSFETNGKSTDRGDRVYAVLELGRTGEDPTVDRVFYDEAAAQHHAARIQEEANLPAVVNTTRLE